MPTAVLITYADRLHANDNFNCREPAVFGNSAYFMRII